MALQSHPVLQLPEILNSIFGLLDRQSNAANAQVCEAWFNVALDALRGDVYNVPRLFAILAPLEVSDNGYEFARAPKPTDWKRFDKYATHVRRLEYRGVPRLTESAFGELARTRRQLNILPNLQTLIWFAADVTHFSSLFMHSGIQKLWLIFENNPVETIFEEVIDRMPNLSDLDINGYPLTVDFAEELSNMLKKLTSLRKVSLPVFCYNTQIFEVLSHLQLLGTIEFSASRTAGNLNPQSFPPVITAGAFPALSDLDVQTNFLNVVSLLQSPYTPSSLVNLTINSELVETPDSVRKLAFSVSKHLQELKELSLASKCDFNIENFSDTDANGHSITLETLKPLFHLPHLTFFDFHHQYPLLITQQDIEMLASSCPAIESLSLCSSPVFYATNVPELSPEMIPPQPFMSLHFLSFGVSIIKNATPVAIYLSQLIPPECKIYSSNDAVVMGLMGLPQRHVVMERDQLWSEVGSMVTALSKIIAHERRRTRALECELQELRARTGTATLQD